MKQGRATHDSSASTKQEPISKAVNVDHVAQIGLAQIPGTRSESLYEGRGLSAPMKSETSHPSGSQGKH